MKDQFTVESGSLCINLQLEHDNDLYSRWSLKRAEPPLLGTLLKFKDKSTLKLWTGASQDALSIDFLKQTTRPDVASKAYVGRPGLFLSSLARSFTERVGQCVLTNGNNIGYWGNQFLIVESKLIYKNRAPIFFEPGEDISGSYPFILQQKDGRFIYENINLRMNSPESADENPICLRYSEPLVGNRIANGISGYPLIENGRPVWQKYLNQAWDPKLLYFMGEIQRLTRHDLLQRIYDSHQQNKPLLRHGLTFLALDSDDNIMIVVVSEQSILSLGINLSEAANLLLELGAASCIVLGGKGDAQLATSAEGILIEPLISEHDKESARPCDSSVLHGNTSKSLYERPIPSFVAFGYRNASR